MYTEFQQKLRERDDLKVVRQWVSSPVIYDPLDSRSRTRNPDYHPPVYQTEAGAYVNGQGDRIPKSKIPAYILEEGMPPEGVPTMGAKQVSLADAMRDAMTPVTAKPQPQAPRRRGRPKGSKNKKEN